MRRKEGTLLPIELAVLDAGLELRKRGPAEFYGFLIAKEIKEREGARLLTAHGTLYKALDRMEKAGLLVSRWEDPSTAAEEGRPRRRLYRVTVVGEGALTRAPASAAKQGLQLRGRSATP